MAVSRPEKKDIVRELQKRIEDLEEQNALLLNELLHLKEDHRYCRKEEVKEELPRKDEELAETGQERSKRKYGTQVPCRPLSAFIFFSKTNRPEVQQAHPEWRFGQVAQEIGRMWKNLNDDEKKKYEEMATQDKGRFEEEMRVYEAGGGAVASGGGGKKSAGHGAAASASASHPSAEDDERVD